MRFPHAFPAAVAFAVLTTLGLAAPLVPNADFDRGGDVPEGWRLSGGQGRWADRQALEVTGTGKDSNQWSTSVSSLEPGALYHFQVRARRLGGSGCVITGPSVANRDYYDLDENWQWRGHVFRLPDGVSSALLRVGQWEATGAIQFDAVRLTPTVAVHRALGSILLGEGEAITGGRYTFRGAFDHPGGNYHRVLQSASAPFNSDRWCPGGSDQITYRFHVPGHPFENGQVEFTVNYHVRGSCLAEASRDGRNWLPLARQDGRGSAAAGVPASLFPAETVFLRLRPATPESHFQINRVAFEGKLQGAPPEGRGRTLFADQESECPGVKLERMVLCEDPPKGIAALEITLLNTTQDEVSGRLSVGRAGEPGAAEQVRLAAGSRQVFSREIAGRKPGTSRLQVQFQNTRGGKLTTGVDYTVADYYRADYGQLIEGLVGGPATVWWCEAARKVPRLRPLPKEAAPAAALSAARNDHEALQLIVRPEKQLERLSAAATPLRGPGGATIAAEHIKILRVYYHQVENPTDATGVRDWWPDALPPLGEGLDVQAGENQPLWVLVHVPRDAKAGDYTGKVQLRAKGYSAEVPLRLHVWNFTLPEKNHLDTALGLDPGEIFRYHQLKNEADKRQVLDLYFQSFAEHRISPYNPTPLDPIRAKLLPESEPPRAELDFAAFDRAMARAVERFHFTNFTLHLEGMGGGTFHERWPPKIGRFTEDTPQYQAVFSSYLKQIEDHLKARGWLGMAYTYWFDEPDPKDYQFVRDGNQRIRRYGPGIARMLTEEPNDALAGAVDIWCPLTPNYDHPLAEKRRAHGERFWWYVCCGPKTPFCTLFIDHPATELRVWLWQTWQRKITGVLVWATNYWTSSAAYPDKPQNPYRDPMSYVSGYSTPAGTKQFWGNGDGRFLYPPLAAAEPAIAGPGPVLEGPVSSIRWEMLREGIEDYEYLWMLRDLIAKRRSGLSPEEIKAYEALLEVPAEITASMTQFATDPTPLYARRAAVAAAIERLGAREP